MNANTLLIAVAVIACSIPAPALAGGRVELRGGAIGSGGTSSGLAGVAAGYDFDLPLPLFFGAEVSLDADLSAASNGSADVLIGLTGRVGTRVGIGGKLYVAGGQTIRSNDDTPLHLGGGYQQSIGPAFYVKAEYRHFFARDIYAGADSYIAGVGLKF